MIGVLLAGGSGTRLWPLTALTNKHLLPVDGRPLVYYPLALLMAAGIREIVVVTSGSHLDTFQVLVKLGRLWRIQLHVVAQAGAHGIADGMLVASRTCDLAQGVVLALGDNVYGPGMGARLAAAVHAQATGATVFARPVADPQRFGVVELAGGRPVEIVEKPAQPRSDLAVTGVYVYDGSAVRRSEALQPSARGELEITDLNTSYLQDGELRVEVLHDVEWMDSGTVESLRRTDAFVGALPHRNAIGCPELEALRQGWIDASSVERMARMNPGADYARLLLEGLKS